MTLVYYKTESLVCPQCKHRLVFGYRWFAPAQVQCGYCKAILSTGLVGWDDLDKKEKNMTIIREVLNPSWFGVRGFSGYLLHLIFIYPFISVIAAAPISVVAMILMGMATAINSQLITIVIGLIGIFLFLIGVPLMFLVEPALNVRRLKRMIDESKKYKLYSTPPVWKKFI